MYEEVYELFRNGDREATNRVIDAHKDYLYNFCLKLTMNKDEANLLFKDTFLRVIRSSKHFQMATFNEDVRKVATRRYLVLFKESMFKRATKSRKVDVYIEIDGPDLTHEDRFKSRAMLQDYTIFLKSLSVIERTIIVLRYYEKINLNDVADIMQIPYEKINKIHSKITSKIEYKYGGKIYEQ